MKVELVLRQRDADCQWPEGKEMDISKLKRHYLEAKKEKKEEEKRM